MVAARCSDTLRARPRVSAHMPGTCEAALTIVDPDLPLLVLDEERVRAVLGDAAEP